MLKDNYYGEVEELNKSLGKIPIVFSDNEDVIKCYDNLLSIADDKNLLRLIKSMCTDRNFKAFISDRSEDDNCCPYCSQSAITTLKQLIPG